MNAGSNAKEQLAARVKALARERGMTVVQLADAASYTRRYMSTILSGRAVPSLKVVKTLDRVLDAGGELVALRERAEQEQIARRHGLALPAETETAGARASLPPPVESNGSIGEGELMPADRRQMLTAAALSAILATAADTSRALAAADPDPLTLDEVEAEVAATAGRMFAVPHAALFASVADQWAAVDRMLAGRLTLETRSRLTMAAGYQAFYLASLGSHLGQPQARRRFLVLARQYADDTGDPLLVSTVAAAQSRGAFRAGQFTRAADIAGAATPTAHPYVKARLAACQAEALAAAGYPDRAADALTVMRTTMPNLPPMPGTSLWDEGEEATYTAMTCYRMGDADGAVRHGLDALDAIDGDFQAIGYAHISIAFGRVLAERPDPVAAADEAGKVLDIVEATPDASLMARSGDLRAVLTTRWPTVPEVANLSQRLDRLTLPTV